MTEQNTEQKINIVNVFTIKNNQVYKMVKRFTFIFLCEKNNITVYCDIKN